MTKIMLVLAITVVSLVPVFGQVKAGTNGQPKDLVGGSLGAGRTRVLSVNRPTENRNDPSSVTPSTSRYGTSLNHSSGLNATTSGNILADNVNDITASKTSLRTNGATSESVAAPSAALSQIYRVGVGDVL